jgi:hypothetical protein
MEVDGVRQRIEVKVLRVDNVHADDALGGEAFGDEKTTEFRAAFEEELDAVYSDGVQSLAVGREDAGVAEGGLHCRVYKTLVLEAAKGSLGHNASDSAGVVKGVDDCIAVRVDVGWRGAVQSHRDVRAFIE